MALLGHHTLDKRLFPHYLWHIPIPFIGVCLNEAALFICLYNFGQPGQPASHLNTTHILSGNKAWAKPAWQSLASLAKWAGSPLIKRPQKRKLGYVMNDGETAFNKVLSNIYKNCSVFLLKCLLIQKYKEAIHTAYETLPKSKGKHRSFNKFMLFSLLQK